MGYHCLDESPPCRGRVSGGQHGTVNSTHVYGIQPWNPSLACQNSQGLADVFFWAITRSPPYCHVLTATLSSVVVPNVGHIYAGYKLGSSSKEHSSTSDSSKLCCPRHPPPAAPAACPHTCCPSSAGSRTARRRPVSCRCKRYDCWCAVCSAAWDAVRHSFHA